MNKYILPFFLVSLWSFVAFAQISVEEPFVTNTYTPWSFGLFSLASTNVGEQRKGSASVFVYNFASINYRLGGGRKIGFGLPVSFKTQGYERSFNKNNYQESQFKLQDVFFRYTVYNLIRLPGNIGTYWESRFYLPTSASSRKQGMLTRIRMDFIFNKPLSYNWSIEYINKLSHYIQTKPIHITSSVNLKTGLEQTRLSNTKKYALDHWASVWHRFENQSGLGLFLGQSKSWYNASVARDTTPFGKVKMGIQTKFNVLNNFSFILQYGNEVSDKNLERFGKFRSVDTNLTLLSFIRF